MLDFGGVEHFEASAERVFAAVTDLDFLARNIPDLVSHEKIDAQHLKCTVRPGFSFLRMKMKLDIRLEAEAAARKAVLRIDGRGMGAAIEIESHLAVAENDGRAELTWTARVLNMSGLVATVSTDLVRAAAQQVIEQSWRKLHAQLDGDAAR